MRGNRCRRGKRVVGGRERIFSIKECVYRERRRDEIGLGMRRCCDIPPYEGDSGSSERASRVDTGAEDGCGNGRIGREQCGSEGGQEV